MRYKIGELTQRVSNSKSHNAARPPNSSLPITQRQTKANPFLIPSVSSYISIAAPSSVILSFGAWFTPLDLLSTAAATFAS